MATLNDTKTTDVAAAQRERRALLGAVRNGGAAALAHILIQAHSGDRTAAAANVADLVDALPQTSWLDTRALLRITGIRDADQVRDLTAMQRVALVESLYRLPIRPTD